VGHAFNHRVCRRLTEIGLDAEAECLMTKLGGSKVDGDVDVLAWDRSSNTIFVIECKRLLADRTPGEIAERLREFAPDYISPDGKRGPTRRHLDRLAILRADPKPLSTLTGIPVSAMTINSCLVTSELVPMQFQKTGFDHFDILAAFDELAASFRSTR
jgi:hypothetical protein